MAALRAIPASAAAFHPDYSNIASRLPMPRTPTEGTPMR
jgi:hypothetical protein